jgi:hypothetical protein
LLSVVTISGTTAHPWIKRLLHKSAIEGILLHTAALPAMTPLAYVD